WPSGWAAASERFAIGTAGTLVGEPPDQFEAPFGPTVVGSYAMVAQRHMHEYGTSSAQLAEIAVTMRRHAGLNPSAKYREPITVEDVLASRMISSPLHLLDCCVISDGGGALVFSKAGEGGAVCADGRIGLDGALPVNTDGGGLSSNHPGMRGIFLVIEAVRQLRGGAGPAQVADAKLALVHGTGGMLGQRHSGVTMIVGRV